MANTLVTSVLSLGLSVVFILGIVALVAKIGGDDDDLLNTSAIQTICKPTDYQDACHKALADVTKNTSSTKKDYIFATFHKAIAHLQDANNNAASTRKSMRGKKDDYSKYARADLKNCEALLADAADEIQLLLDVVAKTEVDDLPDQVDAMLVRLTAARSYQTTCTDEIKDPKLKDYMQRQLEPANKHTYNAQKITYYIPDILMDFGVELDAFHGAILTGRRRLLADDAMVDHQGEGGFPSWVSAADRKLLGDNDDDGHDHDDHGNYEGYFTTPEPDQVDSNAKPHAVVAQDGSGGFKSIKEALAAYPANHQGRYIIHVKAGVYDEGQIVVDKNHNNVYMYGDGRHKTVITGDENSGMGNTATSQTATFVAKGERFMAKGIGFKNTIGAAGKQAVAFRSQSPHTIMVDCGFEGYQNTLYYHAHDQFYKNCSISGTFDFIFGNGRAYIQDSEIYLRKPGENKINIITADGRMKKEEKGGVVLQKCKIRPTSELKEVRDEVKSYLGRPWGAKARAMVMQSEISNVIEQDGWTTWGLADGKKSSKNCTFREFGNKGRGANTDHRVRWDGFEEIKTKKEAAGFGAGEFIDAEAWVTHAGVSVTLKTY